MGIRTEELYREYMGAMLVKCSELNTSKVLGDLFCTSFLTYERFKELVYRTDLDPKTSAFLNGVNAAINTVNDSTADAIENGVDVTVAMAAAGEAINALSDFSEEILSSATESTVEAIKGAVSLIIANEKLKFEEEKQEKIDNVSLLDGEDDDEDEEKDKGDDGNTEDVGNDDNEEESTDNDDNGDDESNSSEGSDDEGSEGSEGDEIADGGNPFDEDSGASTAKESAEIGNLAMYTEDNRVVQIERPVQYIASKVKDMMLNSDETKQQLEAMPMEEAVATAKVITDSMIEAVVICVAFCTDMKIPMPNLSHIFDLMNGPKEIPAY